MRGKELKRRGMLGREFVLDPNIGMAASEMNRRFVHDIEQVWENWTPRPRIDMINGTKWNYTLPAFNGLTAIKEI